MIIVEDVHKRYQTDHGPGKWVLQGVSVTIPPKVNVGLVGSNGAGKSTLLRLIGGVDQPTRGRIERRCRVSWPMGFGGGLQASLTGRQNAKFVCRIHGHEADIPDRLAYIQEFAEIGDAFDEPVKTYSSGMKSRLQFGLSLAFDFDVYISDEVTATGDAAFREKAAAAFKKLTDRSSLIMVSHSEGTLRQFCTAGIWLHEGQAHWFDDINDALREYRKSQLDNRMANLLSRKVPENQDELVLEIEKTKQEIESTKLNEDALAILRKGMNGTPETVGHEEGRNVILAAKQAGMELVGERKIATLGYRLKPGAIPVLRKSLPPPGTKHIDLYELHSQCVKAENTK
jgi:capsular polysaccharide transport system ATP-binding protein